MRVLTSSARRGTDSGVSLVELMVVIVIVGILAAVAVIGYAGYIRRARATEGMNNVALIAQAEESYRSEFSRYATTNWNPATAVMPCGGTPYAWDDTDTTWTGLGFRPERPSASYFQYSATAGLGTDTPPAWATSIIPAAVRSLGWYAIEGRSDMRCGGDQTTYRMVNTQSTTIKLNEYE